MFLQKPLIFLDDFYPELQIDPYEYDIMTGKTLPLVSYGAEIEQGQSRLPDCFINYILEERKGHPELRAIEWTYGVYKITSMIIKHFYNDLNQAVLKNYCDMFVKHGLPAENYVFYWDWGKAGSHFHFSLIEENIEQVVPQLTIPRAWQIAWNTAVDLIYILSPILCFGNRFRGRATDYASPFYRKISLAFVREICSNRTSYWKTDKSITFNEEEFRKKPLTIEIRLSENFPLFTAAFGKILGFFIDRSLKRGVPHVIFNDDNIFSGVATELIYLQRPVYDVLSRTGEIIFDIPLPEIRKTRFVNALELFRHLCYHFLTSERVCGKRYKSWFSRVMWFYYHLGNEWKEEGNYWDCYIDEDFQGSLPAKP